MISQYLRTELVLLSSECKRKHTQVKDAAEQLLVRLRGLQSDADTADLGCVVGQDASADLLLRPFLLAIATKQPKLVNIAMTCLEKLFAHRSIPDSQEALSSLLRSLCEYAPYASKLPQVELKILQLLVGLLSEHYAHIRGPLYGKVIWLCSSMLEHSQKYHGVSHIALASLRRAVTYSFETCLSNSAEACKDAFDVLHDLCALAEGSLLAIPIGGGLTAAHTYENAPYVTSSSGPSVPGSGLRLLPISHLSLLFTLELIESVLNTYCSVLREGEAFMTLLRNNICPFVSRSFSDRHPFALTVKLVRIVLRCVLYFTQELATENEIFLVMLFRMVGPNSELWRRSVVLEMFEELCNCPEVVMNLYAIYEIGETSTKVLSELLGSIGHLLRISCLPSSAGYPLGCSSHHHTSTGNSTAGEAVNRGEQVFSRQTLEQKTKCLEQVDKSDPPLGLAEQYLAYVALKILLKLVASLDALLQETGHPRAGERSAVSGSTDKQGILLLLWGPLFDHLSLFLTDKVSPELWVDVFRGLLCIRHLLDILDDIPPRAFLYLCRSMLPRIYWTPVLFENDSEIQTQQEVNLATALTGRQMTCVVGVIMLAVECRLNPDEWQALLDGLQTVHALMKQSLLQTKGSPLPSPALLSLSRIPADAALSGEAYAGRPSAGDLMPYPQEDVGESTMFVFALSRLSPVNVRSGLPFFSRLPLEKNGGSHGINHELLANIPSSAIWLRYLDVLLDLILPTSDIRQHLVDSAMLQIAQDAQLQSGLDLRERTWLICPDDLNAGCSPANRAEFHRELNRNDPRHGARIFDSSLKQVYRARPVELSASAVKLRAQDDSFALYVLKDIMLRHRQTWVQSWGSVFEELTDIACSNLLLRADGTPTRLVTAELSAQVVQDVANVMFDLVLKAAGFKVQTGADESVLQWKQIFKPLRSLVHRCYDMSAIMNSEWRTLRDTVSVGSGLTGGSGNRYRLDIPCKAPVLPRGVLLTIMKVIQQHGEHLDDGGWLEILRTIDSSVAYTPRIVIPDIDSLRSSVDCDIPEDLENAAFPSEPLGHLQARVSLAGTGVQNEAFECLKLICSDFLSLMPESSLGECLRVLGSFGRKASDVDVNLSLTSVRLLWTVSDRILHSHLTGDRHLFAGIPSDVLRRLWTACLRELFTLCGSRRADLRNGASQTLLRSVENGAGQLLSSEDDYLADAWVDCVQAVIPELTESCRSFSGSGYTAHPPSPASSVTSHSLGNVSEQGSHTIHRLLYPPRTEVCQGWDESRIQVLESLGKLIGDYMALFTRQPKCEEALLRPTLDLCQFCVEVGIFHAPNLALSAVKVLRAILERAKRAGCAVVLHAAKSCWAGLQQQLMARLEGAKAIAWACGSTPVGSGAYQSVTNRIASEQLQDCIAHLIHIASIVSELGPLPGSPDSEDLSFLRRLMLVASGNLQLPGLDMAYMHHPKDTGDHLPFYQAMYWMYIGAMGNDQTVLSELCWLVDLCAKSNKHSLPSETDNVSSDPKLAGLGNEKASFLQLTVQALQALTTREFNYEPIERELVEIFKVLVDPIRQRDIWHGRRIWEHATVAVMHLLESKLDAMEDTIGPTMEIWDHVCVVFEAMLLPNRRPHEEDTAFDMAQLERFARTVLPKAAFVPAAEERLVASLAACAQKAFSVGIDPTPFPAINLATITLPYAVRPEDQDAGWHGRKLKGAPAGAEANGVNEEISRCALDILFNQKSAVGKHEFYASARSWIRRYSDDRRCMGRCPFPHMRDEGMLLLLSRIATSGSAVYNLYDELVDCLEANLERHVSMHICRAIVRCIKTLPLQEAVRPKDQAC